MHYCILYVTLELTLTLGDVNGRTCLDDWYFWWKNKLLVPNKQVQETLCRCSWYNTCQTLKLQIVKRIVKLEKCMSMTPP